VVFDFQDTPKKTVEIKTVQDCETALATFADEVKATGKPWLVSITFENRSGRQSLRLPTRRPAYDTQHLRLKHHQIEWSGHPGH
jgi:hypothetical protein